MERAALSGRRRSSDGRWECGVVADSCRGDPAIDPVAPFGRKDAKREPPYRVGWHLPGREGTAIPGRNAFGLVLEYTNDARLPGTAVAANLDHDDPAVSPHPAADWQGSDARALGDPGLHPR